MSYPILINQDGVRVADTYHPNQVFYPIVDINNEAFEQLISAQKIPESTNQEAIISLNFLDELLTNQKTIHFAYDVDSTPDEVDEIGIISEIVTKPWKIVYLQRQDNLKDMLFTQNRQLSLVAMITATIVGLLSIFIARQFSKPIQNLTQTAEIIAQGNFSVRSNVNSKDEIGTLSQTFNQMTTQLNDLINDLEDRVAARTLELEKQNEKLSLRSHQLETVSNIARNINSALDLEQLLAHIANIISAEFDFYHVGIFLLDDLKNYAVLQAASSSGGQRMLARHHRLAVGQTGIVGFVTGHAKPRVSTDVGEDSVYYNNPDLPETRSEMALPLISAGEVIGAIDVQSKKPNPFSIEDIQLFSILAEQVAIAIANNRLYQETTRALNEIQNTHKKYLSEEWQQTLSENVFSSYQYTTQGIESIPPIALPEFEKLIEKGQIQISSIDTKNPDGGGTIVMVPISIRGEVIGVIRIKDNNIALSGWKEDDLQAVKEISDQLGLALENIRLFEKTEKRALRERKALEITSKIRTTTDIDKMVQIAVDELQKELHANHVQVIFKQSDN
jgi:GAF domain-containing protein/HAMP domain-containing protein